MKILIHSGSSTKILTYDIKTDISILSVKEKIMEAEQIPIEVQNIFFENRKL